MSAWISALAPTSTPRRGLIENQDVAAARPATCASTIFCWLPPDRPAHGVGDGARGRGAGRSSAPRARAPRRRSMKPQPRQRSERRRASRWCRRVIDSTSPWRLRSSGTRPMPQRIASRGVAASPPARRRTTIAPVACGIEAEDAPARPRIGRRRPGRPGRRPRRRARENETSRNRRRSRAARRGAARAPGACLEVRGEVLLERAADHQLRRASLAIEVGERLRRHVAAVAQHGDGVAEPEDLLHAVAT